MEKKKSTNKNPKTIEKKKNDEILFLQTNKKRPNKTKILPDQNDPEKPLTPEIGGFGADGNGVVVFDFRKFIQFLFQLYNCS